MTNKNDKQENLLSACKEQLVFFRIKAEYYGHLVDAETTLLENPTMFDEAKTKFHLETLGKLIDEVDEDLVKISKELEEKTGQVRAYFLI